MNEALGGTRRRKRAIGLAVLGLFAVLLAVVAVRASSVQERARSQLSAALSAATGLRARVGGARLDASGPALVAQQIALEDASGHAVLRAKTLRVRATFGSLFGSGLELRAIELTGATLDAQSDAHAWLDRLTPRGGRWPFQELVLHDASASVRLDAQTLLVLRGVDARFSAQANAIGVVMSSASAALQRAGAVVAQGRMRAEGKLVPGPALAGSEGRFELDALRVAEAGGLERAALRVAVASDKIAITGPVSLRAGLGAFDVAVNWPRVEGAAVDARFEPHALQLSALAAQLGWRAPWLAAQLDGELALRGTLAPLALSGTLHVDARGLRLGAVRADGSAPWTAARAGVSGRVQIDPSALVLEDARIEGDGSRFSGRVRVGHAGAWTASLQGDCAIAGSALGQLAADVRVEQAGDVLRFTRAEINDAQRRLSADELLVDLRGAPSVSAKLRVARLPLAELYRALGAKEDPALSRLQAQADGSAALAFTRGTSADAIELGLQLDLREASFDGYRFDRGKLRARIELPDVQKGLAGGALVVEQLALGAGTGEFAVSGEMRRGVLKLALALDALPLERVPWFAQYAPLIAGRAQGKGELLGSAADPRLSLALALTELRAHAIALGSMKLDARLGGDATACAGMKAIEASGAPSWSLCGQGLSGHVRFALAVGPAPARGVRGAIELDRLDLDAFLPERGNGRRVHGSISAALEINAGGLQAPEQLTAALSVQRLELGEGEALLSNPAPFVLRVQHGALSLSGARLVAPKLEFDLSASGALGAGAKLIADGSAQASLWSGIHALVSPFGDVRVHAEHELGGRARTRVELEPRDVTVLIGGEPLVRKLRGKLLVEEGRGTLQGVGAQLGGGVVALGGEVSVRGFALDRYALTLAANNVAFQPQDHVDMAVDADGALRSGDGAAPPTLSGVLRVKRLVYGRHIEFPAALMGSNKKEREDRAGYDRTRDRLLLDLTLVHDAPLRIRNNLLDAEFVVGGPDHALKLTGSDQRIGLRGKVEMKRGRVMFHGDEFQLTHGEISFDEATRIDPNFEVRAIADARKNAKANIVFAAHGDRDAFDVSVRCDAPVAPPPFTCDYARDKLRCDDFDSLVQIWVCQPKSELSRAGN